MATLAPKQRSVTNPVSTGPAPAGLSTSRSLPVQRSAVNLQPAARAPIGRPDSPRDGEERPFAQEREPGGAGAASSFSRPDFTRIRVHALSAPAIQTKLAINKPGDEYEQEADRVAEQVMRMPDAVAVAPPAVMGRVIPGTQRKCSCGGTCAECKGEQADDEHGKMQRKSTGPQILSLSPTPTRSGMTAPPTVHEVLNSPGQPLNSATRAFFEPRFGVDFSNVRIHADEHAAASSRAVNARAYTVGQHIAFAAGEYGNDRLEQQKLLAHELTHTVQQSFHPRFAQTGPTLLRQYFPFPTPDSSVPALSDPDPTLSPRYIDTLFESASLSLYFAQTTFYWKEGARGAQITIPLIDVEQNDGRVYAALSKIHDSKKEALKTVEHYTRISPSLQYYSFYRGPRGVIMPTKFTANSAPQFHKLWPALKQARVDEAHDIANGLTVVANAINPYPCTEVDEKGKIKPHFSFFGCVLPLAFHGYNIHEGVRGPGGPKADPHAPTPAVKDSQNAPADGTAPHDGPGAGPQSAVHEAPAPTQEVASFAQKNGLDPGQVATEVAELNKEAGNPEAVHPPADPHSPNDAELNLSDGHEMNRDKKTGLWERCSKRCKPGLRVDPNVNRQVDGALRENAARKAKQQAASDRAKGAGDQNTTNAGSKNPIRTAKDVISSGTDPLVPGRSDLGQYGIDRYGTYSNRPGDKFAGHEMLQNLWLEVKGFGARLTGSASKNNPAMALSHAEHVAVGREQRALGLFDGGKLKKMTAEQVIDLNALAMKKAGVPDFAIAALKQEALKYAKTLNPQ